MAGLGAYELCCNSLSRIIIIIKFYFVYSNYYNNYSLPPSLQFTIIIIIIIINNNHLSWRKETSEGLYAWHAQRTQLQKPMTPLIEAGTIIIIIIINLFFNPVE